MAGERNRGAASMVRLVMCVYDEQEGVLVRAYSVTVADGRASVRPLRSEWAGTARRVEDALNKGCLSAVRSRTDVRSRQVALR